MDPIRKAIWYIEAHFDQTIGLQEISAVSGLSRFHLSRTFAQVTGHTVSNYLRGRRLSQAAQELADGAPDILTVALAVGYGSHEAFTRAFRDHFGTTPEAVRASRNIKNLQLVKPIMLTEQRLPRLRAPDIREMGPFLMAGVLEFRTYEDRAGIPAQWQRFSPHIDRVMGRVGSDAFGVCLAPASGEEGFDYLTAVAVRSLNDLSEGLSGVRLNKRPYAVFRHDGHVSKLGATCSAISQTWNPGTEVESEREPLFLIEHYCTTFNPNTGLGGIEVWVPLKSISH